MAKQPAKQEKAPRSTHRPPRALRLDDARFSLLERLCQANGVSGDEGEVRKIVLEEVRPLADEVKVDALGNVLVTRRGKQETANGSPRLRVMLDAHMDEVGLMLTNDEGDGIFRFDTVGGVDARQLVGKPVWIGGEHVPGVIGAKPIHHTKAEERKSPISLDILRIDVGPAGAKVKVGDRAVFASQFQHIGPSIRAKAIDDRIGVAILIDLLKNAPEQIDLLLAFSVQEEIGGRGARVAAFAFAPDLAIAVDSTPAHDLPHWDGLENAHYNTRLGAGPAIYIADTGTLSDPRLIRHFIDTAEEAHLPYQLRQPGGGGTDAGAIHKQLAGIPTISISVPGRYAHTPALMMRVEDWQNTLYLLHAGLSRLTPALLAAER